MSDRARRTTRWLGTTVDMPAVRRDAVLAGVFAGTNAFAATSELIWLLFGTVFGAFIGMVLHVLPAEPRPGDSRRGRVIIRGICGAIGGAGSAAAFAFIASGVVNDADRAPTTADQLPVLGLGALLGGAWYVAWGFWEMRGVARQAASD